MYVRAIGDESNCFSALVDNTPSEEGKAPYERERFVKSIRAKHTHGPATISSFVQKIGSR